MSFGPGLLHGVGEGEAPRRTQLCLGMKEEDAAGCHMMVASPHEKSMNGIELLISSEQTPMIS